MSLRVMLVGWALLSLAVAGCAAPGAAPGDPAVATGTPERAPRTTQELIEFVQQAAGQVRREGTDAFAAFGADGSPWRHPDVHLFVLSPEGRAQHFSSAPHLVGQEIAGFTDMEGRPFVHWQLAAVSEPDGTAWAFYQWPRPQDIEPTWTASYAQRTTGHDGRAYVVGAGVYGLRPDRELLAQLTHRAAEQLERAPQATRRKIDDPQGPFAYRDVRVLIIDRHGQVQAGPEDAAIPPAVVQWLQDGPEQQNTGAETLEVPAGVGAGGAYARRLEIDGERLAVMAFRGGR